MGSFCKNHIKFDLKMYRRVISHDTEEWCKVKRKTDLWFQVWHEEFCEFSPDHSKVQKFHFDGPFLSKVYEVWAKKYRGVTFYDTKQWWKIWINFDSVVWKIAWGIGWTFIRALKSLKIVHWWALFCPKDVFQLENFRGTMCHDTDGCCKIQRKTDLWSEKWHKEFG